MSRNEKHRATSIDGAQIAEYRIGDWKLGLRDLREWTIETVHSEHRYRGRSVLDLRGLGLTSVPKSLRSLQKIDLLDLSENEISEIPDWLLDRNLTTLNLQSNRLTALPESIGRMDVVHLFLGSNQLRELPDALGDMPNLQVLSLGGNRELRIPESILAQEQSEKVLQYYFESRGESGPPLQELKLMLVGRGKAGKTTLVKRLAGELPDANESETHSIAIRELPIETPRGTVRTRAWDFGGQEILHSTHQFFLTERSLYLLVLEPRSGMAQRDAEYWLKLIETQGGGSPVIVVMNWSRERPWQVDEVKLRRKFPTIIVDFIATDAMSGDGIDALRAAIVATVNERMPDVWLPFPLRWRTIKDTVAGMTENFLTFEQYAALCAEHWVTDPERQADLAGILHALGLALYFGRDQRLHDTRVLNPGWVTGGVYAVIRSPSVKARGDGRIWVADMPRVLREAEAQSMVDAADYPPETHPFILELMRAFQLCYASEDSADPIRPDHYLVPELLPDFEPEMSEGWEAAPVRLRYTYDVLPPGLLARFIVRTHALSDNAPHWRHGVVLRHGEVSALIREESDCPELHVFVRRGEQDARHVLVTMVRRELESLHREMKVAPVEDLELTGEEERWIDVGALREFEESWHVTRRLPVKPQGTARIDVPLELNKLGPAESRAIERNPASAPQPVRVFVSYAHKNERQLHRLDLILDVLELQHGLVPWRDKRLIAGDEWDEQIRQRLEEMDIFLFIASQHSLVSRYIRELELRRAQERHAAGEVEIVSVALERCAVNDDPVVGRLQRLAAGYESIADANPRSAGWEQVRKDLLPVIARVRERKDTALEETLKAVPSPSPAEQELLNRVQARRHHLRQSTRA